MKYLIYLFTMIRLYLLNNYQKLKRNISLKIITTYNRVQSQLRLTTESPKNVIIVGNEPLCDSKTHNCITAAMKDLSPTKEKRYSATYRIIQNSNKRIFTGNDVNKYVNIHNDFLKDKKLITISPGGYLGFYMMGVIAYLKTNYDLSDCVFSGSSAGAWNAVLASYNSPDFFHILRNAIVELNKDFKTLSIIELEYRLKTIILHKCYEKKFDFEKCYIGVTHVEKMQPIISIYTDFENLLDALNCCIASSHIPFITGGMTYKYNGLNAYDGGFSYNPNLRSLDPYLKITPDIWTKDHKKGLESLTTLFSKSKYDLCELFDIGYIDTHENRGHLNKLFTPRKQSFVRRNSGI